MTAPALTGVYLFVRDMDASLAFYERLGLNINRAGPDFASAETPGGLGLSFGTAALTRGYDPNWQQPSGPAPNTLNFTLASREAVDAMYTELVAAGYTAHLAPIDAFWGSRYAIVDDPDGNVVSLHSPVDADRRGAPPV
jgi:catechol 2,3-dioxygenase-like lactoylglutathione lyase family enzyme